MIGGIERKIHFLVMDLPQSDACFVKAYPGETTEAFCDGHISAFDFFGGVPVSILYDNTTIAVARILGDGRRKRTRIFNELVSHYLFEDRFGRPGKAMIRARLKGWSDTPAGTSWFQCLDLPALTHSMPIWKSNVANGWLIRYGGSPR